MTDNPYETDELLGQYLDFHYGPSHFDVPNYPQACVEHALTHHTGPTGQALDLGCAVGRSTFELARRFDEVIGIDLSRRFIDTATRLAKQGQIPYQVTLEGELTEQRIADLPALGLSETAQRTRFQVSDACALQDAMGSFDLIFAGNLIDRLPDPTALLAQLSALIRPGGLLMITSPYTLLTEFTPRERWIGGFEKNGQPVRMLDGLRHHLDPDFVLLEPTRDLPFVIRETSRKYQHTVADASLWRRR